MELPGRNLGKEVDRMDTTFHSACCFADRIVAKQYYSGVADRARKVVELGLESSSSTSSAEVSVDTGYSCEEGPVAVAGMAIEGSCKLVPGPCSASLQSQHNPDPCFH